MSCPIPKNMCSKTNKRHKSLTLKHRKNIFVLIVNANSIVQHEVSKKKKKKKKKNGIVKNVNVSVKNIVCEKGL